MSIGISVSARINASSSETWAALENIESHVHWMKDVESIHFTTAGRSIHRRIDGRAGKYRSSAGHLRLIVNSRRLPQHAAQFVQQARALLFSISIHK